MIGPLIFTFVLLALGAAALWGLSLRDDDVSIVDIGWGLGVVLVTWVALAHSYPTERHWLLAILVTLWGVRLSGHLYLRHEGEDTRYQRIRDRHGDAFRYSSMYLVFGLQAALLWFIALPLQICELTDPHPSPELGTLDSLGMVLFFLGFAIETGADVHLYLWKRDPANLGKVLDAGLWKYSRHPNYFGEILVWWGFYFVAAASGWAAIGIWSPILVAYLLLKVSGIPALEAELGARKRDYASYIARTSMLIPMPPKPEAPTLVQLDVDEEADTAEQNKPKFKQRPPEAIEPIDLDPTIDLGDEFDRSNRG
ncbi:MAG: DUF1295 domain-containing protein [Myxococcales bacterium]|nr:DUF1295 domain-containing protein [Myxococcales bacterium]